MVVGNWVVAGVETGHSMEALESVMVAGMEVGIPLVG